ncbi:Cellulose synthase protein [Raphanus sativus]|nr:Cellulose synthase protein [Raphanus sativus]
MSINALSIEEWWRNEQYWVIGGISAYICEVVQDAMNNGYQSWGRLFGKLFLLLLDHCSSLPIPHKGLRQLCHRKIHGCAYVVSPINASNANKVVSGLMRDILPNSLFRILTA